MSTGNQDRPQQHQQSISVVDAGFATDLATAQTYSENVFLFVPNLIGYTRVILAALSLHFMSYHPVYSTIAYTISCLLDAFDGYAARRLGQSSNFGAVLDMVTDRATTSCLLCYLSIAYPTYAIFFQFLIALDFSSHYMHMYSSLLTGSKSHKLVTKKVSRILWYYYNDSRVLFLICAANELFFVALYLNKETSRPIMPDLAALYPWIPVVPSLLSFALSPLAYLSQLPAVHETLSAIFSLGSDLLGYISLIPILGSVVQGIVSLASDDLSWAQFIALVTFPVCFLKNIINLVQLWKASKVIVGVDLAEREKRRQKAVSLSRPSKNPSSRILTPNSHHAKRLTSSTSNISASADAAPPPTEPPTEEPTSDSSPDSPSAPAEEAEKTRTRRRTVTSVAPKEPEVPELPDDLDILWTPSRTETAEEDSSALGALPPDDILEEALHNLHIALHPQTQNRAVFSSPLGPPIEPSLGLFCPIEGGEYVIDATVKELARRTGAEVLVLDAVQLAAGEWGQFGPAANSLQLPRNPLHFASASSSTPRAPPSAEDDDDLPFGNPTKMMLTFFSPSMSSGPSMVASSSRRTVPASKVKVFFDALVNIQPKEPESKPSASRSPPRLIYIRDFPTLASTASVWYPPLLSSIRQRRKGAMSRSSSPVPNPMAIIFGMTPPITAPDTPPEPHSSMDQSAIMNMLMKGRPPSAHFNSNDSAKSPPKSEWDEGTTAEAAREKRLRHRLKKWERGENLVQQEYPKYFVQERSSEEPGGSSRPEVVVVGPNTAALAAMSNAASLTSESESGPSFFRTSILVPSMRSATRERESRVARRREINELTMRMGIGAIGGTLQQDRAESNLAPLETVVEQDGTESSSEEPVEADDAVPPKPNTMWESWGQRLETWKDVRRIADRALGSVVASRHSIGTDEKASLDRTPVTWQDTERAWTAVRGHVETRKSWIKDALPARPKEAPEDEASDPVGHDEVIENVKNDPDLSEHEHRLLPCIVNSTSMSTTFRHVHLPQHTIDSVRSIVSLPLLHPKAFQHGVLKEYGMNGCLLFGPPGTGKTLVVRALAKEAGCRMMVISPSDVMDMYIGEGEKLVKAVFSLARRLSPCVVFLDEIDALFGARTSARESSGGGAIAHRGVITEFMQEMDGLKTSREDNVIVIGATNRPFDLDDAILRRLPRRLLVDLPGEKERAEILRIFLRDETLAADLDVTTLAQQTEGFSGSDLKNLCVSAAVDAVKEHIRLPWTSSETLSTPENVVTEESSSSADSEQATEAATSSRVLSRRHFDKALREITPSSSEALGSLAALRKWNEEFGEGRNNRKKRQLIWGKGLFGFNDKGLSIPPLQETKVIPAPVDPASTEPENPASST
ncbi:hypothetical protein VNI00_008207 [Paramarasmius palmivorus]|uniref:CDP-diacylglycerol--inositol 3-phosphatidyltransferase n=1 Tax=Paramarasmius palmivorus TaxID=297713 RepID=A0AAW0CYM7_9AGAR